ncbi:precorrin-3B synthase [Acetobacter conturbans]|uniref:Precorrin-3B synthase n=1 Tax=Acetobacter conturbans TaxID=1737472 RepID=A0ABX0JVM0_9PROT|nr:precorrin-3B synthase [Acetobacter conturbans]NHN87030.1 precorrin-3B synthase [Acetobacter conturbans]
MTAPLIRGWCPGALRPMQSGDGLLVRIRPPAGRLTQTQTAGLAMLAARHGNGLIDLSARANLQIRGVTEEGLTPLIAGLSALGLIDPTPEAEARRNVIVTPYWLAGDGTKELADDLSTALRSDPTLGLPGKFGFAVDTGAAPALRNVSADIRIERDSENALLCRADGVHYGTTVTPQTAVRTALALARWFLADGGKGRMATHLAAGATLPPAFADREALTSPDAPAPTPHKTVAGFLIGFAFGQIRAQTLSALSAIAPLRVTPWRMVLLEGQRSAPEIEDIISRPDDPLLHVVACPGAPACGQALQPTRPLARALASYIRPDTTLHVSGCEKGCAHPAPAHLTLVAQAEGFGLVRDGTAAGTPVGRPLTAEQLQRMPGLLRKDPDALSL